MFCLLRIPQSGMNLLYKSDEMVRYNYISMKAVTLLFQSAQNISNYFTKIFLRWLLGLKLQRTSKHKTQISIFQITIHL